MAQLTAPRSDFPRVWGHPEALPSEPPVPVGSQVHRASRRCVFPLSYLQLPPLSVATAICQSRGSVFSPVTFSLCPTHGAGRPSRVWGTDGVHTSAVPPTMHLRVLNAWACGGRGNTGQAVHPGGSFTALLTCKRGHTSSRKDGNQDAMGKEKTLPLAQSPVGGSRLPTEDALRRASRPHATRLCCHFRKDACFVAGAASLRLDVVLLDGRKAVAGGRHPCVLLCAGFPYRWSPAAVECV